MKVTKLNLPFDKVEKILQFADIHIRLNSRHDEYRNVLSELYNSAKLLPENSLIVCCGDILHQKVNLSPEAVQLATDMLKSLVAIRPTIVIPGNHDALVSNKSRLDSLSPIISVIDNPNLFYLKTSGLYGAGNILFNHFSALEDKESYVLDKDIPPSIKSKYEKIVGLYHGPVCGMTTDLGHMINDIKVTPDMFDGQQFSLLGDIHAQQNVFIKKDIEEDEIEEYKKKGWVAC
jgi:DNA repair exonuclease SbcCD nuclease subunit